MPANAATSETFLKITGANSTNFAIYLKKIDHIFNITKI
jgi:uncharacterized Fe-S cluster-containing radical SAM superfamily protein